MSTFSSKKEVSEEDAPTCLICLDVFVNGDEIRNLRCSHCFHKACVDIWLMGTLSDDSMVTSICPTCRQDAGSSSSNSSCSSSHRERVDGTTSAIPPEIFLRIGQHLLEEGAKGFGGTPSPLNLSPMPPTPSPSLSVVASHGRNRFSPKASSSATHPESNTPPSSEIDTTPSPGTQALVSTLLAVAEQRDRHRDRASSVSSLSSSGASSSDTVSSIDEDSEQDYVEISFLQISHTDAFGMSQGYGGGSEAGGTGGYFLSDDEEEEEEDGDEETTTTALQIN
jgi:hypothetical protein